jgi:hypothetical protein
MLRTVSNFWHWTHVLGILYVSPVPEALQSLGSQFSGSFLLGRSRFYTFVDNSRSRLSLEMQSQIFDIRAGESSKLAYSRKFLVRTGYYGTLLKAIFFCFLFWSNSGENEWKMELTWGQKSSSFFVRGADAYVAFTRIRSMMFDKTLPNPERDVGVHGGYSAYPQPHFCTVYCAYIYYI